LVPLTNKENNYIGRRSKLMKNFIRFATLCLALVASIMQLSGQRAPAQSLVAAGSPALPTIDQLLNANLEALGGKAAIEKVTSRVSKGTAEIVGLDSKGTIEVYEKAPDQLVRIVKIPGAMAWASGFDGSAGWDFNPQNSKVEDKQGAALAAARAEADFYQVLKLKARYPQMAIKGLQKIQYRGGERETYLVEATPVSGDPEKFYFDTEDNLLIRHDSQENSEDGQVLIREFYLDYTAVDGVKIPFTTRVNQGKIVFIFRLTEVKQNVGIDPARFKKPAVR
jgi:hypothetical protein